MKKLILALVFILLFSTMFENTKTVVNANDMLFETPVCLTVNGSYIKSDTPGYLEGGFTMVPIRAVTEALRADKVDWNEKTSTATITRKKTTIVLKKNSKTATVNGKNKTMDAASVIKADRFYVPVRFVAETLNTQVGWNSATYTVNITAPGVTVPASMIGDRGYSDNDLYWLSRIINAESQGEPMIGKIAVGNVVLNRVKSPLFDDNIYDVIFDRKHGVQFSPILNGTIYNEPLGDSIVAAKRALRGENYAGQCLYFLNPRIATSFWIVNNRTFFRSIGNHDFYL